MSNLGQNNNSLFSSGSGGGGVTSVGLTMPSAFNVANSPVTGSGTLAVTGAGNTAEYIRGDGSLATFPTVPTVATANGAYAGTITWAGGSGFTNPSGATNHSYYYYQVGTLINLSITLLYANTGTLLTSVAMAIPAGVPLPVLPTGVSGANVMVWAGTGQISGQLTVGTNQARTYVRRNAADNGFDLLSQVGSGSYRYVISSVAYFTS